MRLLLLSAFFSLVVYKSFGQQNVQYGSVPAYPYPIEYLQPDGSTLTILLKGDESVNWALTTDGYTLLKDKSSGAWEYASRNETGYLYASGIIAHNIEARDEGENNLCKRTEKNMTLANEQINEIRSEFKNNYPAIKAPGGKAMFNILVILVNYNNTTTTYTQTNFDNYTNQTGYNFQSAVGSVKDYYLSSSYNQMSINATVLNWVTVANTHDYYGPQANWPILARDAIQAANTANPSLDWSQFDNDNDGYIDAIAIFHQGPGQEATSNTNDVWSHTGSVYNYNLVYDGVRATTYTMQPEKLSTTSYMITIGVLCHELGHNLGLPDFYDTDYSSNGSGDWEVMAGGSWLNYGRRPPVHSCWSKYQLSWLTPVTISTAGTYTLENTLTSTTVYRYNTTTTNEYFLLENRQKTSGTWDYNLPGHGMLIWHIDGVYVNAHWSANTVNDDETHQGLDIEEADGTLTTANGGDGGDPFPGTGSKTSFTDATTPSSKSWAGANTNKPITSISENSGVITFVFMGGATTLDAEFTVNTQNITEGQSVTFTDLSGTPAGTTLSTWSWTFTGGTPSSYSGQAPPAITYSAAGTYPVSLTVTNSASSSNTETKTNYITVSPAPTSEWITQYSGFTTQYRGVSNISIVDDNICWATAIDGSGNPVNEFTRTTNAGTTWTAGTVSGVPTNNRISNISAVSGTKAWIAMYASTGTAGEGGIFVTTNGGSTWTKQTTATFSGTAAFPNIVHFFNDNEGFCQGDPNGGYFEIYTTTNGGTTWTRVLQANIPANLSGEYGYTDMYDVDGNTIWFATNKGRVYKSTNKGLNWTVTQISGFTDFSNLSFNDQLNGVAMFKVYSGTTLTAATLVKTTNGGSNWTSLSTSATNFYFSDIDAIPGIAGKLVSVGSDFGGSLYGSSYSTDHGTSWIGIDNGVQYISCRFKDDVTGWAGGFNTIAGTNGVYKWHNVSTEVPVTNDNAFETSLYPNPAADFININLNEVSKKEISVTVYDIMGNVVYNDMFFNVQRNTSLNVDCTSLSNGVYVAVVNAGSNNTTYKFIVNR